MEEKLGLNENDLSGGELLSRTLPEGYDSIIRDTNFLKQSTPYAENLVDHQLAKESIVELLSGKLRGGNVLDLGCGDSSNMVGFLRKIGVNKYIGIDLSPSYLSVGRVLNESVDDVDKDLSDFDSDDRSHNNDFSEEKIKTYENGALVLVSGDMLDTVSRMEDKVVGGVIMSGVELEHPEGGVAKYLNALAVEIDRILKDGGLIIVYHSDINFKSDLFKNITPPNSGDQFFVYEKVSQVKN